MTSIAQRSDGRPLYTRFGFVQEEQFTDTSSGVTIPLVRMVKVVVAADQATRVAQARPLAARP
ncbi:MAG: hypothetical protein KY460_04650 [Actinobacteria bacterium]|nr:hypothetical protein [Actinomycetota bacterium]